LCSGGGWRLGSLPFSFLRIAAKRLENFYAPDFWILRGRSAEEPAGQHRVLRGASWNNNERVNMCLANRSNEDPRNRNGHNGLKLEGTREAGELPFQAPQVRH
jgi:hypothetical protein